MPSLALADGWVAALGSNANALDWLRDQRGLTSETIRDARIGYAKSGVPGPWSDYGAFTLPVLEEDGKIVTLRKRFWPRTPVTHKNKPVKMAGPRGVPAVLYPDIPHGAAVLLCEGEFDCLVARQHGLPAVTSTAGTSWNVEWDERVVGRRVAVIYDAGSNSLRLARRTVDRLREAGAAAAWAVDLRRAGLTQGEDLTDWFVTYGRSADRLVRLIARERRGR
jgi:hypothetical protein